MKYKITDEDAAEIRAAVIADGRQVGVLVTAAGVIAVMLQFHIAGFLCAGVGLAIWYNAVSFVWGQK